MIKYLKILHNHYFRYKINGIKFLFQKRYSKKSIITFINSEYKNPIYLRNKTTDIDTFYQVLFDNEYEYDYGFVPQNIIDCGANIGLASIFFLNRFPKARIFAVEPELSNFQMLRMNTDKYENICCYHNAIYNENTNLELIDIGFGHWGYITQKTNNTKNCIPTKTINQIIIENNIDTIDILKIDIEGSEKELFETDYEIWMTKCNVIIIELHDRLKEGASKSFFKALLKYNFSIWPKNENLFVFIKS
jgi:FkbM family methyltransferase